MLASNSFEVMTIVRESDRDRNELRFRWSDVHAKLNDLMHSNEDGEIDERGAELADIATIRGVADMLCQHADEAEAELARQDASGSD